MKRFQNWFIALVAVLLLSTAAASAQGNGAQIRFMHAVPGVGAIDIYTNGQLSVKSLAFGSATTYMNAPSGEQRITVTLANTTTPLWEQSLSTTDGAYYTLIASSVSNLGFNVYEENLTGLDFGEARLLFIHAIDGAPAVDVALANGNVIASNIAYGDKFGTFDLPANLYEFAVIPSGGSVDSAILPAEPYKLNSGTLYMAVIYGTAASPTTALLSTASPAATDSGFVRFAHTVVGAPSVDIFVNEALIIPSLSFGQTSEHIALPAGEHTIALRPAGETTDLLTGALTVESATAQTLAVLGTPDNIELAIIDDDISAVNPNTAAVTITNAISGSESLSVALADGTTLAENLAFGDSTTTTLPPVNSAINFTLTLSGTTGSIELPAQTLYGGVYYNVFALSGDAFSSPRLHFAPTSINQGIASAPSTGASVISAPPSVETPVAATPAPEVAQATTPAPTPPPPSVATESENVIAIVRLNPDANLQLRLYPSADAASLGLAPSGTQLIVQGREGAPVYNEGDITPEPGSEPEFVDPALFLADENDDIDPATTWLYVTYNTPDGGTIDAWVNAQVLEVRDPEGKLQRLANLPFVPRNQAGVARGTALTPPPVPKEELFATVFNLSFGVNLNIRRTKGTDGEVLERITNGTVVRFIGISEDREWAFIEYLPQGGGSITGWASALYLTYEYKYGNIERTISLEEMESRGLLEIIPDDRRGEIRGASQAALPTLDPLKDRYVAQLNLDSGANVQFRIQPDSDCESLALIPSGTQLVVNARTPGGTWIEVVYEGQTGWIASSFAVLTFNGRSAEVIDVPVVSDDEIASWGPCVTLEETAPAGN